MSRIYRGAPKKSGPAPGSWGDRYIIENTNERTSVSCSKCLNYSIEDSSCSVRPVFCPIDGWDTWKSCELFELDEQYTTQDYMKKVCRVRGDDFFVRAKKRKTRIVIEKAKRNKRTYQERVFHDEAFHLKPFITYVEGRLLCKYGCNFAKWYENDVDGEMVKIPLMSVDKKICVSVRDFVFEGKSKERKPIEASISYINKEVSMLHKLSSDLLKIIVIVKVPYDKNDDNSITLARKYYEDHFEKLSEIRVVEVDDEGNLEEII